MFNQADLASEANTFGNAETIERTDAAKSEAVLFLDKFNTAFRPVLLES